MTSDFEFEITHKSGLVDCFTVAADSLRNAWFTAERLTGQTTIKTAKVRAPAALGDTYWHALSEARKLEHIARTAQPIKSTEAHA
jgi:hypothetical protein